MVFDRVPAIPVWLRIKEQPAMNDLSQRIDKPESVIPETGLDPDQFACRCAVLDERIIVRGQNEILDPLESHSQSLTCRGLKQILAIPKMRGLCRELMSGRRTRRNKSRARIAQPVNIIGKVKCVATLPTRQIDHREMIYGK